MKTALLFSALLLAGAPSALPHGGNYPGPGDTVPAGGSGAPSSGGGSPTPGPSGPGTGPTGPTTPVGSAPTTPGVAPGQPAGGAQTPRTPTASFEDEGHWAVWWDLNKAPYLKLRERIWSNLPTTGSSDFFLGNGQRDSGEGSMKPTRAQIEAEVVPLLLAALKSETNNDIVTGAMIGLARIGDARDEQGESAFADAIRPFLADSNQEISESAALALGILGHEESAPLLAALLRGEALGIEAVGGTEVSFRTRAFAAYGLSLLTRRSDDVELARLSARAFADGLADTRNDVQVACVIGLGLCPLPELESVADDALESGEPRPLESRGDQRALLRELMLDDGAETQTRAQAPVALARLLPELGEEREALIESWLDMLDGRKRFPNELRRGAIQALGLVIDADADGLDRRARAALVSVPDTLADAQCRSFALISLAHIGARPGTGEQPDLAFEQVSQHLLRSLSRGENRMRPWAALAGGVFAHAANEAELPMPNALVDAMRNELSEAGNPELVGALCIGLGLSGDQGAIPELRTTFQDENDAETRGFAAVGLGLLQARESIEEITQVLRRSQYRAELLKRCAIALGLMGDDEVADELVEMLAQASSLAGQASIAEGLGFIGDRRAVSPLGDMLLDPSITARARGFAAASLGLVGARDELPWKTPIVTELNYRDAPETLNDSQGTGIANLL